MFSKQTSSTIAVLVGAILVLGTGIGLPSMNSAQALSKITISQANVAADVCSGIINCVNAPSNLGIIVGAPLATQNINVDGSQNNDQSNTCSDDDLGVPGAINCVNDAATIGNLFAVRQS